MTDATKATCLEAVEQVLRSVHGNLKQPIPDPVKKAAVVAKARRMMDARSVLLNQVRPIDNDAMWSQNEPTK